VGPRAERDQELSGASGHPALAEQHSPDAPAVAADNAQHLQWAKQVGAITGTGMAASEPWEAAASRTELELLSYVTWGRLLCTTIIMSRYLQWAAHPAHDPHGIVQLHGTRCMVVPAAPLKRCPTSRV